MDDELLFVVGAGVLVMLGLVFLLVKQRKKRGGGGASPGARQPAAKTAGADKLVRDSRLEDAARLAMRRQNWEEAMDLYRRAGQPGNAAHAARRGGKLRQAGELYEMAGDADQAADCWEGAGLHERAKKLRAGDGASGDGEPPPAEAADGTDAPVPAETTRAAAAEARFRQAVGAAAGDLDKGGDVQQLARHAAEELLAAGEMRRAAEVYRDAGLEDEAIHLYVNVLGSPGEAAPLLAARGNHPRAAELYELAGQQERAASQWVEVARQAERPDSYVDRIAQLSSDVAFRFLDMETKTRPAAGDNAELHYRFALACEERGDAVRARQILEVLLGAVGSYKDAKQRLGQLPGAGSGPPQAVAVAPAIAAAPADPGAAFDPPADAAGGFEFEADQFVPLPDLPDIPEADAPADPPPDPVRARQAAPAVVDGSQPMAARPPVASPPTPAVARPAPTTDEAELEGGGALPRRGESSSEGYFLVSSRDQVEAEASMSPTAEGDELDVDFGVAPAAQVDLQLAPVELSSDEIVSLVMQASHASARQLKPADLMAQLAASTADTVHSSRGARLQKIWGGRSPQARVTGMEQRPVALSLLDDEAVWQARSGPSIETLRGFIQGRGCDLGNIEVYYRLGLAHLAGGMWSEALGAFDAVEEASPGYRDAGQRAGELRQWTGAMGERRTALSATVAASGPPEEGRYELLGELGRGGMAVVYRAFDRVLGRQTALKFMAEEVSARPELREMFEREARAAASLNHPGIVTIYDFGMIEGRAFICMELVDGIPIDQLLGELTIIETLRIATQALDALEYAHGHKIVHRDIKPANVMRTKSGLVKLMDFGLAKPLDSQAKTSIIAGTPAFMSPEQLSGRGIDHRTDIFAMGVTLYELLTGQLPFDGMERGAQPPGLVECGVDVPETLDDTVLRALELDPELRWPSAAAFGQPLKQVVQAVSQFTSLPPPPGSAVR